MDESDFMECIHHIKGELRQNLVDRLAEINIEPFAAGDFQTASVQAQLLQNRGMNVGDIVAVFDGMETDLIGRSVHHASLDAAPSERD